MNRKESIAYLKGKTLKELLEIIKFGQTGEIKITPEFFNEIVQELNSRGLSDAEAKEFENILNLSVKENYNQSEMANNEFQKEEMMNFPTGKDKEPNKYQSLKLCSGFMSFLGYAVIFIGFCIFAYFLSEVRTGIGRVVFLSSVRRARSFSRS